MSTHSADYLIVGQGLAGSILAYTLDQRGYEVHIINSSQRSCSSKVAGGMFNPVAGHKLLPAWQADKIFPFTIDFYTKLQLRFKTQLLHLSNVYRPYRTVEEREFYKNRVSEESRKKYLVEEPNHKKYEPFIENSLGGLEIKPCGWVNCFEVLEKIKDYFMKKSQYFEYEFDIKTVNISSLKIKYRNINYKKILFCEGTHGTENPFFNWLPFNPAKGQILTAQISDYTLSEIVNQGVWVLPLDQQGLCKIGSTYSWDKLDNEPTQEAREFLENKVKNFLKKPFTVQKHEAGVRPSTEDRRPFVGLHPAFETIGIFNGLGTKGVSLAPFCADQFADFLEFEKQLNPEMNISRYYSLYFESKTK